jgi:two-component system, OmpR family, response regulator TctD
MKLLLIEDNTAMQTTLQRSLQRCGMQVVVCGDGARALDRWHASVPDVVLLDLSLPGMDGLQVLAAARDAGLTTPVLIVTARGTVGDRILGLNTGADDYLPKPFDLDELEARVRALARRSGSGGNSSNSSNSSSSNSSTAPTALATVAFRGLAADPHSHAIYLHGTALDLTTREATLLRALLARPGQAVAKDTLSERVFAADGTAAGLPHTEPVSVQADAIEVVVYRLRKKLAAQQAPVELVTLRGLGYLLKSTA